MTSNQNLTGQVALVTGGGRNIGRAIALELARAGASVAVLARTAEELNETVRLIEKDGGKAAAFKVDVTDQKGVETVVKETEQRFGPISLLVNNAASLGSTGPLWHDDIDPDDWWRTLEVNVRGPFLLSRAVLPSMIERKAGRIVNVSSGIGVIKFPYYSDYAVSKAGILRLSENLAEEVKDYGIKVFAIDPGLVRNQTHDLGIEEGIDDKWFGGMMQKWFADGVDVPPTRAAELVRRLASGEVDALSGCFISINDDLQAMVENAKEIQEDEFYTMRLRSPS